MSESGRKNKREGKTEREKEREGERRREMKATRGRERRDALASDGDLFLDLPVSSK